MEPDPFGIDWALVATNLGLLAIAYLMALPIGFDRETSHHHFGLRTFPLVAVVSCGFMLVGIAVLDSSESEARVIQGIITGIGFLGGGAILKGRNHVEGTATAASIWNTGAMGLAVAYGHLEIAIALSVLNIFTLRYMRRVKQHLLDEERQPPRR